MEGLARGRVEVPVDPFHPTQAAAGGCTGGAGQLSSQPRGSDV